MVRTRIQLVVVVLFKVCQSMHLFEIWEKCVDDVHEAS